jgi:hypothetical protein
MDFLLIANALILSRSLDELVVVISGKRLFLWRAVDSEGEARDLLLQRGATRPQPSRSCANS